MGCWQVALVDDGKTPTTPDTPSSDGLRRGHLQASSMTATDCKRSCLVLAATACYPSHSCQASSITGVLPAQFQQTVTKSTTNTHHTYRARRTEGQNHTHQNHARMGHAMVTKGSSQWKNARHGTCLPYHRSTAGSQHSPTTNRLWNMQHSLRPHTGTICDQSCSGCGRCPSCIITHTSPQQLLNTPRFAQPYTAPARKTGSMHASLL